MTLKDRFGRWIREINHESQKYKFDKKPELKIQRGEPGTHIREGKKAGGPVTKAWVNISPSLTRDDKMTYMVARHEIRENFAQQNYATEKNAHKYALAFEPSDLERIKMNETEYNKKSLEYNMTDKGRWEKFGWKIPEGHDWKSNLDKHRK